MVTAIPLGPQGMEQVIVCFAIDLNDVFLDITSEYRGETSMRVNKALVCELVRFNLEVKG